MRWKCTCAYDGTDFDGWQRQPSGGAVQNHIESALTQVFDIPLQLHEADERMRRMRVGSASILMRSGWLPEN